MYQPKHPFIIDVEASSFSSHSYPIEVGFVLDNDQKFCRLIRPEPDWQDWDPSAEAVHRISKEDLLTHGIPAKEVALELNNHLSGMTLYSDGWAVDKPWLTTLFHAAQLDMAFSVSPLEMILSEEQMARWHHEKDHIIKTHHLIRHRASTDAWIIQKTYVNTLNPI